MVREGDQAGATGAEATRRAAVLRPLVQAYLTGSGSLESGIRDLVWELGVSRATVWRWIRRLAEDGGRTSALVPQKRGRRAGITVISSEVEAVIDEHLHRYYLRRERPSLSRVVTEIRIACGERGLQTPTRRTVQRRLDAMDEREIMKAREGAKAARQRFGAVPGRNQADRPLDVVQIDHTPADIILVDSFERKPIGRPWVTLAIDIATRMVTGYYVSFEAPSRLSVALCLTRAVAPKAELPAQLDSNVPWPAQGKPRSIHVDNGRDFRSRVFQAACGEWGIDLVYRPPGSPHFGGHIERLIGTMMGAVHLLPGTTQSSVAAKGSYNAEAMATMTLSEFDSWFALEICRYNNSIHSSLGCTPVAKWETLSGEMSGDIPFDMDAFRVSFLPSEQRQVRRDGIHLFDIRYWSDALAGHVGRKDRKVAVRYDPRDLSAIWVELEGGRCVEARYRNLEIPHVSLWEYREAMQKGRALGKKGSSEVVLAELINQQRQIADESRVLTKAERRTRERRNTLKGLVQADPPSEGLRPVDTGDTSRPLFKVERW
ncbi:Mu transposase C-terminal domain-containing protein [Phyllobacterium endophyticum]|uniref:Transposase n=1 Tax=Phyllobacterium endophyticum TaxID=1149773 RepID=A0A2P7AK92_9HYPH|nr:Mu transposase C-terminal domain-containing protein [Phyllobacterium endophyticum]MBB3237155.1 putative transposase [Phyllobacterium endophyticum]PSH54623.1 transposase [Phyllobacterium endophyticum]TYR40610.1 DDE-type integrase/transposase/recombinase [Phyllobacterium endophyticum]